MNLLEHIDTLAGSGILKRGNIRTDSRRVVKGDVFVAIKGTARDGHDHINEAIGNGASLVVSGRAVPGVPGEKLMVVPDPVEALVEMARKVYEDPSALLKVYGVTGTNGKTTTVFLIDTILTHAGISCGFTSTVFMKTSPGDMEVSNMTTPDVLAVNNALYRMKAGGMEAAAIEVSSHALSQRRIGGIGLDAAVFTNITPEHLDYHKDMDSYLRDKVKIFGYLKPGGLAAVNADDPMIAGYRPDLPAGCRLVRFGMGPDVDVSACNIEASMGGTEFDLNIRGAGRSRIRSRLIGGHNVYNMLSAVSALLDSGISPDVMGQALEKARPVPGRLEAVDSAAPFRVFVDYAHTPNALENVLKCLRPLSGNRLICVFGCGGDRDRTKRPVMGRIASEMCDRIFITSDNPRTEQPEAILEQIRKGVPGTGNYSIIGDRREAISNALAFAAAGDIVLIAGKGHEDYQIIGDTRLHFDDKEVAAGILMDLGY